MFIRFRIYLIKLERDLLKINELAIDATELRTLTTTDVKINNHRLCTYELFIRYIKNGSIK